MMKLQRLDRCPAGGRWRFQTPVHGCCMKDKKSASLFQKEQVMESLKQSFVKLNPRVMIKNPIMFTVELVTLVMLVVCILSLGTSEYGTFGYNFLVFVILFVTLLFANFAEAIAEARGKAQASSPPTSLRSTCWICATTSSPSPTISPKTASTRLWCST